MLELMDTSQSVWAYSWSTTESALDPRERCSSISTLSVVKSLIVLMLTLPFCTAPSMEAIRLVVVVENGTSRMTSFWAPDTFSIRARILIFPRPSSYSETSIDPPWMKSGASV